MPAVTFGPFRLDLITGELQRSGIALKLQPQPAKLLVLLVEHAGQLVTRDLIRRAVWGDDTFVDFDQSVNFCIRQIRNALHDQADTPCYVETVPRRGYRFVAPVQTVVEGPDTAASTDHVRQSWPHNAPQSPASPQLLEAQLAPTGATRTEQRMRVTRSVLAVLGVFVTGVAAYRMLVTSRQVPRRLWFEEIATPLTAYPGTETKPSLSPDGSQVGFVWNGPHQDNFDIYVKLVGAGEPIRLTTAPQYDDSPAWSPDGSTIAFVRVDENNVIGNSKSRGEIFVVPALGGAERRVAIVLVNNYRDSRELSWTPDGKWLVFDGAFPGADPPGVWVLSVTGRERRRLTSAPAEAWGGDVGAQFSPDGRRVAFIRQRQVRALYVQQTSADLIPTGEPVLIESDARRDIRDLTWAPDSGSIIYSSGGHMSPGRLRQVWLGSNADHPAAELLPFGEGASTISVTSAGPLVYSTELSDTNLRKLDLSRPDSAPDDAQLPASTLDEYAPAYSFDGKRVAFVSTRSGSEELWISNVDGTGLRQVTFMGGSHCSNPQWSRDGRTILFNSSAAGSGDLYLLSTDSLEPRRLTTDPGEEIEPKWSRDGQWIYFGSNRTGVFEVWKMRSEGGRATQITHGGGLDAQESSDGRFVYYASPQSPTTIWRMPVRGGKVVRVVDGLSYPLNFVVSDEGIYFVGVGNTSSDTSIDFFDFRTSTRARRAMLGKPWSYGIGLSPDRRWLMFPVIDTESQNLMMVNRLSPSERR